MASRLICYSSFSSDPLPRTPRSFRVNSKRNRFLSFSSSLTKDRCSKGHAFATAITFTSQRLGVCRGKSHSLIVQASSMDRAGVRMTAPSSGNAFVYGTLIAPEVLSLVIGRVPAMQNATLQGFKRYRLLERPYPGILPDSSASVKGKVLTDISQKEMDLLDEYEGEDYYREGVEVVLEDGTAVKAGVYVWKHPNLCRKDKEEWNFETWRSTNEAGFQKYLKDIETWKNGDMSVDEYLAGRKE